MSLDDWLNDVHVGDARDLPLPDSSVHCVMTSPPYFGQREYDAEGQIGLEDSVGEFIDELVDVARELRRVLRPDGQWWLNLGDSFAGSWGAQSKEGTADGRDRGEYPSKNPARTSGLKRKNKMLVPHRVAIALQDDGWVVRSDLTWVKSNYKPHSVKDRPVNRKELLFQIAPEPMYWWDLESIRVPAKESSLERSESSFETAAKGSQQYPQEDGERDGVIIDAADAIHPNGKNPGDVIVGPVSNYSGDHSATFPEWLCELPIKSSCPPHVCPECGSPFDRIVEEGDRTVAGGTPSVDYDGAGYKDRTGNHEGRREGFTVPERDVLGWEQQCECDVDTTVPGTVLDPFAGAGTTAVVAKRLGRRFVGFDIDPESVTEARQRLGLKLDDGEGSLSAFADGGGR